MSDAIDLTTPIASTGIPTAVRIMPIATIEADGTPATPIEVISALRTSGLAWQAELHPVGLGEEHHRHAFVSAVPFMFTVAPNGSTKLKMRFGCHGILLHAVSVTSNVPEDGGARRRRAAPATSRGTTATGSPLLSGRTSSGITGSAYVSSAATSVSANTPSRARTLVEAVSATTEATSPNTPIGAKRMMNSVIFIITWNTAFDEQQLGVLVADSCDAEETEQQREEDQREQVRHCWRPWRPRSPGTMRSNIFTSSPKPPLDSRFCRTSCAPASRELLAHRRSVLETRAHRVHEGKPDQHSKQPFDQVEADRLRTQPRSSARPMPVMPTTIEEKISGAMIIFKALMKIVPMVVDAVEGEATRFPPRCRSVNRR